MHLKGDGIFQFRLAMQYRDVEHKCSEPTAITIRKSNLILRSLALH